jgi:hypothetical protein
MENQEELLLEELNSSTKSAVVAAIVRAAAFRTSERVVAALQKLTTSPDREISLYAKNALSRMNPASRSPAGGTVPGIVGGGFSQQSLLRPRREEIPGILQDFRSDPGLVPEEQRFFMAEFLGKHGNSTDVPILLMWLSGAAGNLVVPFLDSLSALDRQKFLDILPAYLASEHPFVRAKAVCLLRKADPDEAFAHLNELLASEKPEEKLAGLEIAVHFPFQEISALLFTLMAEPNDPAVAKALAVLLLSNPELETAFRLLELREVAAADQADMIDKLLVSLGKTLVVVGLLPAAEGSPAELVKRFQSERMEKYLAELEIQVSLGDPQTLKNIEAWLAKNREDSRVKEFIRWLGRNPSTEDMYRRLCLVSRPPAAETKPGETGEFNFRAAGSEEKVAFLATVGGKVSPETEQWICTEARQGEVAVRSAALKALVRLPTKPEYVEIAEANLDHTDSFVIIRAFGLLEKNDKSRIPARVRQLLTVSDPVVVSRAFVIAMKHAREDAIKTAIRMLESDQPQIRAHSVKCLMVCPFSQVSGAIFAALPRETHPNVAKGLLFIIMNNPCPEALKELDHLSRTAHPGVGMLVAQTRGNLFKVLLSLDLIRPETIAVPAAEASTPITPVPPQPIPSAPKPDIFIPSPVPDAEPEKYVPPPPEPVTLPPIESLPAEVSPPAAPPEELKPQKEAVPAEKESPASGATTWKAGGTGALTKAYSTSAVRNTIRQRELAEKQAEKSRQTFLTHPGFVMVACVSVLFFVGALMYRSTRENPFAEVKVDERQAHIMVDGFKMNVPCKLIGKVESIEPDHTVKFSAAGRRLRLEFVGSHPVILGSETAEVEVVPYWEIKSGEIMSQCFSYQTK